MSNIISINHYTLEEYRENMLNIVDLFFEVTEVSSLEDVREAFEYEMYIDNNLADQVKLSREDLARLHDIHIEVLDYMEEVFLEIYVDKDILVEFKSEFDSDDDYYYEFVLDLDGTLEDDYEDNAYWNDNDNGD